VSFVALILKNLEKKFPLSTGAYIKTNFKHTPQSTQKAKQSADIGGKRIRFPQH
jgi:hypothetical protein